MSSTAAASNINIGELVLADRVHGRLYHDADLFQREMDDIFSKVWVYLGHESEVPNNGDYVRRQIGLQPVIVVRGKDGKVRVFFNRCRHRANLVCHHERGNEQVFRCPYHGWTYSNQGDLIAPTFDEAYEDGLRNDEFGLTPVPRVQSYRGLIFASAVAGRHQPRRASGRRQGIPRSDHRPVSGGRDRTQRRNAEDALPGELEDASGELARGRLSRPLHPQVRVRPVRQPLRPQPHGAWTRKSTRYLPGGHMVEDFRHVKYRPRQEPSPARKAYVEMLVKTYGAERMEELTFGRAPILFVFPNLMFVQTHIRRLQPVSVNETHVYYQPALLKGVPPEINQEIIRSHETSFGPAGFLSPDDIEVMERNQIGLQAKGNEWLFIGRGIHRENKLARRQHDRSRHGRKPASRAVAALRSTR